MLRIGLCDDSADFRRLFSKTLKELCARIFPAELEYEICGGFGSADEVLSYIEQNEIDVLFLDIDMPKMSGLELAKRLISKNDKTVIAFVSGYDHYVYEVFEFSPFAFLRKDRLKSDLTKTLTRLVQRFTRTKPVIKLSTADGSFSVCPDDVLYVRTKGNYYICVIKNGAELKCRGTMNDAETLFADCDFFRVHSAYIVNLHHIQRFDRGEIRVGDNCVKIPVAQRRLAEFRAAYAGYNMRSLQI